MRLQTILKPNKDVCDTGELYFHEEGSSLNADGFFNLFYIKKHKLYSDLDSLRLKLKLKGWASIILMHDRDEISESELEPDKLKNYEFEFPYQRYDDGVFWFSLIPAAQIGNNAGEDSGVRLTPEDEPDLFADAETADADMPQAAGKLQQYIEGFYEGDSSKALRRVNIAVDICTYKREQYVLRNMRSICKHIYNDASKDVREHLDVMLIDNGKTLSDNKELAAFTEANPQIKVYNNENAGGAGGFTRGMLEALRKDIYTHILIMDDDAVFEPDIFVRLYGFLSTLKDGYKDITVGGALMREELPFYQFASGEQYKDNKAYNPYPMKDMRIYENCTAPYMCDAVTEPDTYSGWWCCCFSMHTVRPDNLPLPVFIHCDDIEYGLRNQDKGIVFLNGICVWHRGQEYIFPGANRYYDVRNKLIMNTLHKPHFNKTAALKIILRAMTATLMAHRYAETELAYRGLRDFCRGAGWLQSVNPEQLNNELRSRMHWQDYKSLAGELTESEYQEASGELEARSGDSCIREGILANYGIRVDKSCCIGSEDTGLKQLQSYKGSEEEKVQLKASDSSADTSYNGIPLLRACDSQLKAAGRSKVIYYDPTGKRAMLAKHSLKEDIKALRLYPAAACIIWIKFDKAAADYREKASNLRSAAMWEKYLKLK